MDDVLDPRLRKEETKMTTALLEVDNLSIGYRDRRGISLAVDGVSFTCGPGRLVGAGG
jgi:ABC-type glutathione transport system ATPase component